MERYSIEPRTRKCIEGYGFLSFSRNLYNKYRKKLFDAATQTEPDPLKTASKQVVHKAAEVTGELKGNKVADKIVKPKSLKEMLKKC